MECAVFRWSARAAVLCGALALQPVPAAGQGACSLDALAAPQLAIENAEPVRFERDITRKAMAHTPASPEPFKIKVRRAGPGASSFNNEPRYELAALAMSQLLYPPGEDVVPPIALRSESVPAFHQIDPSGVEAWRGTNAVLFMVQCWLTDATPHRLQIDAARFAGDPAYARTISRLNVLTYLIEHKDSNLGNVMLTGEGSAVRAWAIDNGVAFGSEESDVGIFWKSLHVDAVDRALADRLRSLTLEALRAHLGVIAQYQLVDSRWQPREPGANFDTRRGVRRRGDQLQLGLTTAEIGSVERRRQRLVSRIDKGDIRLLPDAF